MSDRFEESVAATVAETVLPAGPRIEIVSDRRRRHDPAFRDRVVQASYAGGVTVRAVARRYGVCVSLIYRWRRETPAASSFIPLAMLPEPSVSQTPTGPEMTIALPTGARIEVPHGADLDRIATLVRRLTR